MPRPGASITTRVFAIVGAGFVIGTGHSWVRTAWFDRPPIALTRQAAPPTATSPAGTPDKPATPVDAGSETPPASDSLLDAPVKPGSITLREAYDLFEQGAFFLDARYEDDFRAGHVEGAFWMPAARVPTEAGIAELQIIEPGGTVVIYCTGGDCDASENTAIRLEAAGFNFDVRILGKGYEDWAAAGLPVSTGDDAEAAP